MLIVAAFALLVVALVLLFLAARKVRAVWGAAALIACSAVLFAVHARASSRHAKQLHDALDSECRALASALERDVLKYRTLIAPSFAGPSSAVAQFEDGYRGAFDAREQLIRMCTPTPRDWNPWDCLPATLTRESTPRIERAAVAIRARMRCDTR